MPVKLHSDLQNPYLQAQPVANSWAITRTPSPLHTRRHTDFTPRNNVSLWSSTSGSKSLYAQGSVLYAPDVNGFPRAEPNGEYGVDANGVKPLAVLKGVLKGVSALAPNGVHAASTNGISALAVNGTDAPGERTSLTFSDRSDVAISNMPSAHHLSVSRAGRESVETLVQDPVADPAVTRAEVNATNGEEAQQPPQPLQSTKQPLRSAPEKNAITPRATGKAQRRPLSAPARGSLRSMEKMGTTQLCYEDLKVGLEMRGCTFRPDLRKTRDYQFSMTPRGDKCLQLYDLAHKKRDQLQRDITHRREENENAELAECTFRPQTARGPRTVPQDAHQTHKCLELYELSRKPRCSTPRKSPAPQVAPENEDRSAMAIAFHLAVARMRSRAEPETEKCDTPAFHVPGPYITRRESGQSSIGNWRPYTVAHIKRRNRDAYVPRDTQYTVFGVRSRISEDRGNETPRQAGYATPRAGSCANKIISS